MTLLPLHPAFVWLLRLNPSLPFSFAALTVGSLVPDLELVIAYVAGASVFCGVNFPCEAEPDRLVLHSLLGAVTIDVVLTIIFVKLIGLLRPERLGINGFRNVRINAWFCVSAAVGSISHILVDWFHHQANPIFWPIMTGDPPSFYVDGLLMPYMSISAATFLMAIIGSAIVIFLAARAVILSKYSLAQLAFDPKLTLSLLTESLNGDKTQQTPESSSSIQ
jgi:hypothetical protein